jgi:hypothetical protein
VKYARKCTSNNKLIKRIEDIIQCKSQMMQKKHSLTTLIVTESNSKKYRSKEENINNRKILNRLKMIDIQLSMINNIIKITVIKIVIKIAKSEVSITLDLMK